jgi:hypothetical protein
MSPIPFPIDESWTSASIPLGKGTTNAFFRQLTEEERGEAWEEKYSLEVARAGGNLVTRLYDPTLFESGVTPNGEKTYKATFVSPELWYTPRCTFEESIQCLKFFGIPGAKDRYPGAKGVIPSNPCMENIKDFLNGLTLSRSLTMNRVSPAIAQYKLVEGRRFTREEMMDVIRFNDVEFGASREPRERREYIKTFLANNFFVIGAF